MKQRHIPGIERLETRETPDISLGAAVLAPPPGAAAVAGTPPTESPGLVDELPGGAGLSNDRFSLRALEALFASGDDLGLRNGDLDPAPPADAAVAGDGLQGWHFLCN